MDGLSLWWVPFLAIMGVENFQHAIPRIEALPIRKVICNGTYKPFQNIQHLHQLPSTLLVVHDYSKQAATDSKNISEQVPESHAA